MIPCMGEGSEAAWQRPQDTGDPKGFASPQNQRILLWRQREGSLPAAPEGSVPQVWPPHFSDTSSPICKHILSTYCVPGTCPNVREGEVMSGTKEITIPAPGDFVCKSRDTRQNSGVLREHLSVGSR